MKSTIKYIIILFYCIFNSMEVGAQASNFPVHNGIEFSPRWLDNLIFLNNIEEWGVSASGTKGVASEPMADVRNSEYSAAFLTELVTRLLSIKQENDRKIERLTFCSSGYEKIPSEDFMGYRTLDTKHGFHKPILNAYKLLDKLAPELIPVDVHSFGESVTAVASRDANKITIVVTNYQYDKIYNEGEPNEIALNINSNWKPEKKVTLKHWRIDKTHSNAYTAFKEAGSPKLPNPIEIDEIKKKMNLELLEPEKQTTVGELTRLEFELPCNAVSLIEISAD